MDLRSSLNLPDQNFTIPMKADLPNLEPRIQKMWDDGKLYHVIQASRVNAQESFILHDGPPYTNSLVHIGTALNKILKDFVVKSRTMMGYRAPYIPGFDNHGLPIEQAVLKTFQEKKILPSGAELREACREHVNRYIKLQTDQFKRLGVLGLWERPYATMDFKFEGQIVRVFKDLVEKGYVYKGLRPTLWSPTSRTALADTEIVYKDHVSKAIYVRFPLRKDENGFSKDLKNFFTIIWTTTPWTIPANLAVAFNPNEEYAVVEVGSDHYLIAEKLVENVAKELEWEIPNTLYTVPGYVVENSTFSHPIFDRESLAVLADYVTMEDGTGVVHTAPGHGRDDFFTGQKYDLPVLTPVDPNGVLNAEAGEFAGVFYKNCDTVVVDRLRELGNLLKAYDFPHSYPYSERDEQPVIFRATEQWFISLEHDDLRSKMLEQIQRVNWIPGNAESRITAMIANRPDWCISRQRPWGVGIPIFYGLKSGVPVLDPVAIEAVATLVTKEGSGAWFDTDPKDILPAGYTHPSTGETEFRKETDVLDVWFDSGSTNICVLDSNLYPEWTATWPADLYLEGSDQHRGWFNTSLITGTATHGSAPYRSVLTHGFVTDEHGRKQSKRLGNVVEPEKAANTHGADVIRYWVASVDYNNDVPCSDNLLKAFGENYRNVRNTLRFLLSNLYDLPIDAFESKIPFEFLDEWALEQADLLVDDCVRAYGEYDFGYVINAVHNFCRNELSNFYLDVIKDRLYCDGKDWESRRSAQRACRGLLIRLLKLIAPIMPHTAEETWQKMHGYTAEFDLSNSVHLLYFDAPSRERLQEIEGSDLQAQVAGILAARRKINTQFELFKAGNEVKDSQDVVVLYTSDEAEIRMLDAFPKDELAIMLKVSEINLKVGADSIEYQVSPYLRCERSRLRRADVKEVDGVPLTARDRRALGIEK